MKTYTGLQQQAEELKQNSPHLRNRDAAIQLGISEFEYLMLDLGTDRILLEGDWKELLRQVHKMGYIMALTRNESCVHERKGVYENITFYKGHSNMGVAVNEDIDLRFFMNHWTYGMAVVVRRQNMADLYSFQFFTESGEAIHKIYSTEESNLDGWHEIVAEYKSASQTPFLIEKPAEEIAVNREINLEFSIDDFQKEWLDMNDTHEFFGLLKKYKLSRPQALRFAPEGLSEKLPNDSVNQMLEMAVEREVSIMCFTGSKGCIQIHSGPVKNIKEMKGWLNILDSKFNLHLRTQDISQTWVVKKPTSDGIVTSLELFDKNGELITYFFGARKPGKPELPAWREIINDLSLSSVQ